jgi:hypothetical protein
MSREGIKKFTKLDNIRLPDSWTEEDWEHIVEEIDETATGMDSKEIEFISECLDLPTYTERQKRYIYKIYCLYL